jgi:hypothetical protein
LRQPDQPKKSTFIGKSIRRSQKSRLDSLRQPAQPKKSAFIGKSVWRSQKSRFNGLRQPDRPKKGGRNGQLSRAQVSKADLTRPAGWNGRRKVLAQ